MSFPLTSRYLVVNGLRTHFLEAGDPNRTTVLLIHDGAWGADAWCSWRHVAAGLATDFHVVAPDLIGFGESQKAIFFDESRYVFRWRHLMGLLDVLGVEEPVHVVGSSFGGSLALRAVAARLDEGRVKTVTSICGTGGMWRHSENFAKLKHSDGSEESIRRIMALLCDNFPDLDEQIMRRQKNVLSAGSFQAMSAVRLERLDGAEVVEEPGEPFMESLSISPQPMFLIEGVRDDLLIPGWAETLAGSLSNSDSAVIDTKHCPNIDHAATVESLLRSWFGRNR